MPLMSGPPDALVEGVDPVQYVLVNAQQNHVVDSGAQDHDAESFVHAGPGHCLGGGGDLLGLAKEDALGTGLAGVKRVGLCEIKSVSCVIYYGDIGLLTQNHGRVLQIAPAIAGGPKGDWLSPSCLTTTCLTVS